MPSLVERFTGMVSNDVLIAALGLLSATMLAGVYLLVTKEEDGVSRSAVRCLLQSVLLLGSGGLIMAQHYVAAIAAGIAWVGLLILTPWYKERFEQPQYQKAQARLASRSTSLVVFLRPFALDWVTARRQKRAQGFSESELVTRQEVFGRRNL